MCHLRFYHYNCGHKKKTLRGVACSQAYFNAHSHGVPSHCPVANIEHIHLPGDCRRQSALIACQVLPHLDDAQRKVLEICDKRVREVQNHASSTTRRILAALAHCSGGRTFRPRTPVSTVSRDVSGRVLTLTVGPPPWMGGLLAQYYNEFVMMDAAYFGAQNAYRMLSTVIGTCQLHILNGYTFLPNHAQIVAHRHIAQSLADVILIPVEEWARTEGARLEQIAHAMENLGAMVTAREATQGQYGTGASYPMSLPIRQRNGSQQAQHNGGYGQSVQSTDTQAPQSVGGQVTQTLTAVQPSQATLNDIDEMIEMLSRQHITN
jgi:hypothetical protein